MLPRASTYDITIPDNLPELEGSLSRKERVEIALDVIATLKSRQRKFVLTSIYFEPQGKLPESGQLNSSKIRGECYVCARGMLFIKSLDRRNHFDMSERWYVTSGDVTYRTADEWGDVQATMIEAAFEGYLAAEQFYLAHFTVSRKELMIAICQNIISNHGEFIP